MRDDLVSLYAYTRWADERMLAACAALTADQAVQPLGGSFPTLHATLFHVAGAAIVWQRRLEGIESPPFPHIEQFPDIATIDESLKASHEFYGRYVATTAPETLGSLLRYKNLKGEWFERPLWLILRHIANHATYHRGQVVHMLRMLGVTPPSTDIVVWWAMLHR
jgi:uncharacterized damage-inducible protein DinB